MDVVAAWCRGVPFVTLYKMTDVFEVRAPHPSGCRDSQTTFLACPFSPHFVLVFPSPLRQPSWWRCCVASRCTAFTACCPLQALPGLSGWLPLSPTGARAPLPVLCPLQGSLVRAIRRLEELLRQVKGWEGRCWRRRRNVLPIRTQRHIWQRAAWGLGGQAGATLCCSIAFN